MTIIGLVALCFFSIVFWRNYIEPCGQPEKVYIDTCKQDTTTFKVITDTLVKSAKQ